MNNRRLTNVVLVVAVLVVAGLTIFTFATRAKAEEGDVMGGTAVTATAVGTAFTYQGSLQDSGNPVTATCDMQFSLWSGIEGVGSQVGSTVTQSNVQVDAGIFSVSLDFGDQFQGDERLLYTSVRCPAGGGNYTDLTDPVFLTAAPYALSLRPGATISSDDAGSSVGGGAVVHVEDTYSGMLRSTAFKGISSEGTGVYGETSGSSPTSYGVYSEGPAHVEGQLTWKAMTSYVSVSTAAFIPDLYNDVGFVEYDNMGNRLINQSVNAETFVAPIQLPHGATVTEISIGWHDASDDTGYAYLRRRSMTNLLASVDTMATISSVGSPSTIRDDVRTDDSIDYATIDNGGYTYYLVLALPNSAEDIALYGVTVEYTIDQPY